MRTICCTVALLFACQLSAQEEYQPAKPGAEHKKLAELEGTWEATIHSEGGDSKGKAVYKMGLGGLWLTESFSCEFGGQEFTGHGLSTYDANKKQYVTIWVDSMSTAPTITSGTFEGNTLTQTGKMPTPDGKGATVKMVSEQKDKDTRIFKMFGPGPEGKMIEMITITYKRKK